VNLAAIGWLGYLQMQQQQFETRIQTLDPALIETISTAQTDQAARLAALENQQDGPATREQLNRLRQWQSETVAQLQNLEAMHREGEALYAVLNERLGSLEQDALKLKELHANATPAVLTTANPKAATQPPRKRAAPVSTPFTLVGIETRADESFASIAPTDSFRLDQVRLLKSGESYQDWRLLRVEPAGKAVFVRDGREQVVSLR
jgi:small-conductance mechanosensitive channel